MPVAAVYHPLNSDDFLGVNQLRLRSGTAGVPVNQGAERLLIMAVAKPAR